MGLRQIIRIEKLGYIAGMSDLNHNGKLDFVGLGSELINQTPNLKIFERENDTTYVEKFIGRLVDKDFPEWIGDSDDDGLMEIMTSRYDSTGGYRDMFLYEAKDSLSYPDTTNIIWIGKKYQFSKIYCEDTDNDGKEEFIYAHYFTQPRWRLDFWECTGDNTYELVDTLVFSGIDDFDDLSFGDVNGDGTKEIIFGTIGGNVYVVETIADNKHKVLWKGTTGVVNSYANAYLGDADGDGKNEFVVGGNQPEMGYHLLTLFEAQTDSTFDSVWDYQIFDFPLGGQTLLSGDIENDGKKDFMFENDHKIWFLGFDSIHSQYTVFLDVDRGANSEHLFDLNNNGKDEILLSGQNYTIILEYDKIITSVPHVTATQAIQTFSLQQNYPNPFNSQTVIQFSLPKTSLVTLAVFDISGRQVQTLLRQELSGGSHSVIWNAQSISSGMYFVVMNNGSIVRVIKTQLIK